MVWCILGTWPLLIAVLTLLTQEYMQTWDLKLSLIIHVHDIAFMYRKWWSYNFFFMTCRVDSRFAPNEIGWAQAYNQPWPVKYG